MFLDDITTLTKTYLRRGLAYELKQEKELAVADLNRVLELSPENKQAQEAIDRIGKTKQDSESLIENLPEIEGVRSAEELFEEAKAKKEARKLAKV